MSVSVDDGGTPLVPSQFEPFYEANAPRAVVALDGKLYIPSRYTVSTNAHGATNTATVTLPIEGNPDFTVELFRGPSGAAPNFTQLTPSAIQSLLADSSQYDTSPVYVEIYAGFPGNDAVSASLVQRRFRRFLGVVDTYSPVFHDGVVTFACRSLAQPLVDDKLQGYRQNQLTTDFVKEQAAAAGLTPFVNINGAATSLLEVLGYENLGGPNLNAAIYGLHPWDLILKCAQFDDADAWVVDDELHYEAPSLVKRNTIALKYGRDWRDLDGAHSPLFAKNIQVEVRTYQKRTKLSITTRVSSAPGGGSIVEQKVKNVTSSIVPGTDQTLSTYTDPNGAVISSLNSSTGGKFTGAGGTGSKETGKERYVYYVKNVSPATANKLANALWRQLSMHEYSIHGVVPMTNATLTNLSITSLIQLDGTPYQFFNSKYWPRQIDEEFDVQLGWTLAISAVNHQPPAGAV